MPTPALAPAFHAAIEVSTPSWLLASPVRAVLWIATTAVVMVLGSRFLQRRGEASVGEVVSTAFSNFARVLMFAVCAAIATGVLNMAAEQDTALGHAVANCIVVLTALGAWVLAMFLLRQLLAPPWWRLDAWDPTSSSDFGIRHALEWIRNDVRDLLASLRPLDRIIAIGGLPLAMANAMLIFGPTRALIVTYIALATCYVALVFSLFSANRIPRALITRLQELRRAVHRIANGEFSARVGYAIDHEYEELGQLVADINSMARSLEERENENRSLNLELQKTLQVEQERASTDQLTGLRNHRYFQESLAAELYRCTRTGETTTIAMMDLDDFKMVNDTFGHQEGDAVLKRAARALEATLRPYDLPARLGGEEFGIIFPSTSPEEAKAVMDRITEALVHAGPNGNRQGFSGGIASFPIHATDQSTLYQLADSSSYAAKLNGKGHTVVFDPGKVQSVDEDNRVNTRERDAQIRAAKTLVQTVDAAEGFGNEHSENVGVISQKIAAAMGYDDSFAQQMYLTGLLHDVGKLGLDQSIVQKSGQLTDEEYEQVKRHPELSSQIVRNAGLVEIATWVRHHHEHFDGTGYPMGLAGQDIPVGSRIILVAEAFDVMTSTRSYRKALSLHDAIAELVHEAGTRFDPSVVQALYALVQAGEVTASDYSATVAAPQERRPLSLPTFDDPANAA